MVDRWVLGLILLFGFLWVRTKARDLGNPEQSHRALYGIYFLLAPMLLGEKWLFDRLPYERFTNLGIESAGILASFALIWLLFLRPKKA